MADPNELSNGSTLGNIVIIILIVVNRFWGNANSKKNASDVKIATSSHEQVTRLETRVMGLQNQVTQLNDKVSKMLPPDDRGPTKET